MSLKSRRKFDPAHHQYADGALTPGHVRMKKKAIVQHLARIPDDLSRSNSDTLEAAAKLIEAIARRCVCTLSPAECAAEVEALKAGE